MTSLTSETDMTPLPPPPTADPQNGDSFQVEIGSHLTNKEFTDFKDAVNVILDILGKVVSKNSDQGSENAIANDVNEIQLQLQQPDGLSESHESPKSALLDILRTVTECLDSENGILPADVTFQDVYAYLYFVVDLVKPFIYKRESEEESLSEEEFESVEESEEGDPWLPADLEDYDSETEVSEEHEN